MTEPTSSNSDPPLEASIPEGAVSVESILCTEELSRRPSRPPDYKQENRALQALASALGVSHSLIKVGVTSLPEHSARNGEQG